MRLKPALAAGAIVLALATSVIAQQVIQDNISGNECWNAGQGPGGPSTGFLCSNTIRNSTAKVATTLTGNVTYGVGALATLIRGGNILITAQPTVAPTITLPANPVPDGAIVGFCNVTGSNFATTAIAWAANSGQTLSTAVSTSTLGANACKYAQFNRANTTWYVIQ